MCVTLAQFCAAAVAAVAVAVWCRCCPRAAAARSGGERRGRRRRRRRRKAKAKAKHGHAGPCAARRLQLLMPWTCGRCWSPSACCSSRPSPDTGGKCSAVWPPPHRQWLRSVCVCVWRVTSLDRELASTMRLLPVLSSKLIFVRNSTFTENLRVVSWTRKIIIYLARPCRCLFTASSSLHISETRDFCCNN